MATFVTTTLAAQEKPPTRYYDKHGTEIHKGDTISFGDDNTRSLTAALDMTVSFYAKHALVLSRADGTPVYRYKGGEDVRVGDVYLHDGIECEHGGYSAEARVDVLRALWAQDTLIRRAYPWSVGVEKNEPSRKLLATNGSPVQALLPHTHRTRSPLRTFVPLRSTSRRGRCSLSPEHFVEARNAELVEEKAESFPQPPPGLIAKTVERIETRNAAIEAIESLCRALAQPTMAERFERFKARMTEQLEGYTELELSFDCDEKNGPLCLVRHESFIEYNGCEWFGFNERASDQLIQEFVRRWADCIGRRILRGGK